MLNEAKNATVVVRPARNIAGALRLAGDKSISHRYAMLAAIAEGTTRLENFSTGADCASTLSCLTTLGVEWERKENAVLIHGRGPNLQAPRMPLDCGNSGSTMRMLSGILAGQGFSCELFGDESLSRRPMARIIAPLEAMGAKIAAGDGGRPPLRISGTHLKAIDYKMPVASAQVKSALLFAGLFAEGETRVEEPVRTRDHGELALRAFGAEVTQHGNQVRIAGGQRLPSKRKFQATFPARRFFSARQRYFPDHGCRSAVC
jgi:3-phosphoshikimate 1-carboxyvinyltransferase